MPKKRFSAEQIVTVLRQIEVLISQGKAAPVACREAGISQQSYYRWRKELVGAELLGKRQMRADVIVVVGITAERMPKMPLPKHDDVVKAFPPH